MLALTGRYPAIGVAFWRDCVVDANILAQWNVNIAHKDAAARVAYLLCEMSLRYRVIGLADGTRFPFPITDLVDAVGLTPAHLNRVLGRLRNERLATKNLSGVTVENFDGLADLGEFEPEYVELAHTARSGTC